MANKNNKWLRDKYYKTLIALGEELTGRERLNTLKKKWKKLRQDYIDKGEKPPTLYRAAKEFDYEDTPRDSNMNTEPAPQDLDEETAKETIDQFISLVDQIYQDTLRYIDDNKEGTGHEGGKLASIADNRRKDLDDTYFRLKEKIEQILNSGAPVTFIAQAIKDNVELDYVISVALVPPSDLEFKFETTIEQLDGVMVQIESRARELSEEAEKDYYGQ